MMTPTMAELLAALPQDEPASPKRLTDDRLQEMFEQLALRPVPVRSFQRLWVLGGLQARLALAYLAWYLRTWFHSPDQKEQQLLETNLRSALQTLQAMGYLRGAVMKVGQALAYIQYSLMFSNQEMQSRAGIVDLVEAWANFYWEPLRAAGSFDYGNPDYVNRGIALWKRAAEVRVIRQQPVNVFMHRCNFDLVALLYRLRSQVDCRRIYDEELKASGWFE
jgi:hypothetical protein